MDKLQSSKPTPLEGQFSTRGPEKKKNGREEHDFLLKF